MIFLSSKPITLKRKGRGGGGFLCSSISNHDAKGWKGKTETQNKEKEPTANYIREGENKNKNKKNNYLYDACNEYTYDACSNALKFVQFYFINHQLT